ncbi:MAG: hypothetical protein ACJ78H_14390, partial [Chloroflexota bacterium]
LLPTFHDHETAPVELAVLSPSPAAVDGPDLYSTSIEHRAFGAVLIDTLAVLFRETDAVREISLTDSLVDVGVGVGLALRFAFAVGFGVAAGFFVAGGVLVVTGDGTAVGRAVDAPTAVTPAPSNPRAAGGALGPGAGVPPLSDDPTTAATITTTRMMPTHVRPLRPESVDGVGTVAGSAAGVGAPDFGLETEV